MIGFLRGVLIESALDNIIIDANGVGYIVFCSEAEKRELPSIGEQVQIFIHSVTKDEGVFLYGFLNKKRKAIFMELIKISGVSGKMGNAILSYCSFEDIVNAVLTKDEKVLLSVSGVGKKLANRIINECKVDNLVTASNLERSSTITSNSMNNIYMDAVAALTNMGINQDIAKDNVTKIIKAKPDATLEEAIKIAISQIYSK